MIISDALILCFRRPIFGCSPRPRNKPGGSSRKLPIFSLWPSHRQNPYSSAIFAFFSFSKFFSSFERFLRISRCSSIWASTGSKLHWILNLLNFTETSFYLWEIFNIFLFLVSHGLAPVLEEVRIEHFRFRWVCYVIGSQHACVKCHHFFWGRFKLVGLSVVLHPHVFWQWNIIVGKVGSLKGCHNDVITMS